MPFNTVSSSTKLMCWVLALGHSQQASSNTVSRHSKATPIARELALTHMFSFLLSIHQSPWAGSSCCTDSMVSNIIRCSTVSLASSSQPFVTELAHHAKSTAHGMVPDKLPTHGKYCLSHNNTGNFWNNTSSLPSQFTVFHPDCQSLHSCAILQPLWILALQPKLC